MTRSTHRGATFGVRFFVLLAVAAAGCGGDPSAPLPEGSADVAQCRDGLDNDGDGAIDCSDPDCDGRLCRPAVGDCDVAEACTGGACPVDDFAPAGTECRAGAGSCDVPESCDGASAYCPADGYLPATAVCRAASGACDRAESCDGASAACPADAVLGVGSPCRYANGLCDAEERCDGVSSECPADAVLATGTVCRPAAGICDLEEQCTGSAAACPADQRVASGVQCRAAAGTGCDAVAEACNGVDVTCPPDVSGCASGAYCSAAGCAPQKTQGSPCVAGAECLSGYCSGGVCCDTACEGPCKTCNGATTGVCEARPLGTDPQGACGYYLCDGAGACQTSCTTEYSCASGLCTANAYCGMNNTCFARKASGWCVNGCECVSGFCADEVCCDVACGGPCSSCIRNNLVGTCYYAAQGTDPHGGCGNYTCKGYEHSCFTRCYRSEGYPDLGCDSGMYCTAADPSGPYATEGDCVPKKVGGSTCSSGRECASGTCFLWLCWG